MLDVASVTACRSCREPAIDDGLHLRRCWAPILENRHELAGLSRKLPPMEHQQLKLVDAVKPGFAETVERADRLRVVLRQVWTCKKGTHRVAKLGDLFGPNEARVSQSDPEQNPRQRPTNRDLGRCLSITQPQSIRDQPVEADVHTHLGRLGRQIKHMSGKQPRIIKAEVAAQGQIQQIKRFVNRRATAISRAA